MKKILLITIPILVIISVILYFALANNNVEAQTNGGLMDKKVLIAYFSWSGNTKHIAEEIHNQVGGDMFRIETATPYPSDYNETAYGVAKKQHDENIFPELKDNGDVSNYDVIFVGTPVWWYTMAPAVKTFLKENNFEGKTIVPFVTHGGGGGYQIPSDMEKIAKGATVVKNQLVVYGKGDSQTKTEIGNWLQEINLK